MLNKIKIDRKFWINAVFFLAGGILLVVLYFKYRVAPEIKGDLAMKTLDGKEVHLRDFKGKTVFLNCFATWCGPCCQEMPGIEYAKQNLDTSKIVFIALSDEDPLKLKAFAEDNGYDLLFMTSEKKFRELGINTYPTTYIIDNKGHAAYSKIGADDWSSAALMAQIQQIME